MSRCLMAGMVLFVCVMAVCADGSSLDSTSLASAGDVATNSSMSGDLGAILDAYSRIPFSRHVNFGYYGAKRVFRPDSAFALQKDSGGYYYLYAGCDVGSGRGFFAKYYIESKTWVASSGNDTCK